MTDRWLIGHDGEEITAGLLRFGDEGIYGIVARNPATVPVIGLMLFVFGFVVGFVVS